MCAFWSTLEAPEPEGDNPVKLHVLVVVLSLYSLGHASTVMAQDGTLFCSKLFATGNPEYPPYLWRDPENPKQLIGANAEIFSMISERLGIPIEVVYVGPWSRAQQEVRSGRIDLLAGAFLTMARIQYMDYVYPAFLDTTSVVWTRKEANVDYQRREDLIDQQGITVINNSFGQDFDHFAENNLIISTVPTLKQAFKMLNLGRVDYLLYEKNPALAYIREWGVADQAKVVGPPVSSEGLYLTISHKSSCNNGALRGRLAKITRDLVMDGSTQQALQKGLAMWQESATQ